VAPEDREELVQDGLTVAIQLGRSATRARKKVTPGNIAHYTLLALRSGRRSIGYRKNDGLHPAARVSGHVRIRSMDEPISDGEHGEEPLTLHDCIAAGSEDPATEAGRRLDWQAVTDVLDKTAKAILVALVEGRELTLLVRPLRRSRSALQADKLRLGWTIRRRLGQNILVEAQARPVWTNTVDAVRARLACRTERRGT
jgi:hypothetical protein